MAALDQSSGALGTRVQIRADGGTLCVYGGWGSGGDRGSRRRGTKGDTGWVESKEESAPHVTSILCLVLVL